MADTVKIIGSLTSPFVRITRVICEELGVAYDMELTSFYARNTPEQETLIKNHNPLMKIPVLVHGEETVIESRVIVTYLLRHFQVESDFRADFPASVTEDNMVSTINGIIEAGVLRFIMKGQQPGADLETGYLVRSLERVQSGLAWLDSQKTLGESFGVPEALLICALEWFKKRHVVDWSGYDHLAAVHAQYAERASLVKTRIPEGA